MKIFVQSPAKLTNMEGKARRDQSKKILLGLTYGRGAKSIAEQIGSTLEEAKALVDGLYKEFPKLKKWIDDSIENVTKVGYAEDPLGRIRHLDEAMMPKYTYKSLEKTINPFLICENSYVDNALKEKYNKLLLSAKSLREINSIISKAQEDHVQVVDNSYEISKAQRETLNWQCQAQTASWIKMDMINLDNDEQLREMGAELLLTIHDEVILQVPEEHAEECRQRVEYIMSHTLDNCLCVPMPCDASIEPSGHWYMSVVESSINATFTELITKQGMSKEDAVKVIYEEHPELEPENIYNFLFKGMYLR